MAFPIEAAAPAVDPKSTLLLFDVHRLIAAQTLGPLNRNAIAGEVLLQEFPVLQHEAHGVVIGVMSVDGRQLTEALRLHPGDIAATVKTAITSTSFGLL